MSTLKIGDVVYGFVDYCEYEQPQCFKATIGHKFNPKTGKEFLTLNYVNKDCMNRDFELYSLDIEEHEKVHNLFHTREERNFAVIGLMRLKLASVQRIISDMEHGIFEAY